MVANLRVSSGDRTLKRATEQEVEESMKAVFEQIGFTLLNLEIIIESYGYMPDVESDFEQRYWATFQVNSTSALEIWEQLKGITGRIQNWNQKTLGGENKSKWFVLKIHRGIRFEATRRMMPPVMRLLSEDDYREEDGFRMEIDESKIRLFFEEKPQEKITIKKVYMDHREVFDDAVATLSSSALRDSMRDFGVERDKSFNLKRHHISDDTVSSAADRTPPPTTPPPTVHLATPISKAKRMRMDDAEVSVTFKYYDF